MARVLSPEHWGQVIVAVRGTLATLAITATLIISPPHKPAGAGEPTTVTTSVTTTTIAKPKPAPLVAPYIVAMWEKVAQCETGGRWWRNAPYYDGGLGISRRNWNYFAPEAFPDAPHLASKEQQVFVARKIQAWGGVPNYIPDQNGECHGW